MPSNKYRVPWYPLGEVLSRVVDTAWTEDRDPRFRYFDLRIDHHTLRCIIKDAHGKPATLNELMHRIAPTK